MRGLQVCALESDGVDARRLDHADQPPALHDADAGAALLRQEEIVRDEKEASVDTQVMQEFTTALAKAQQERIRAEALYKQLETGTVEGIPQVLENKVIQEFKAQKAKLETQYQENLKIFKPGYPKMVQLQTQIDEMQAKINEELAHVRSADRPGTIL